MRPPISSTSWALIVSPRPVPPKRRLVDASAWTKAPKICHCCSGAMPMPVSVTVKRSAASPSTTTSRATSTSMWPASVNLIALPTRLRITWRSRPASPISASGTSGRIRQVSSRPFSWARPAISLTASSTVSRSANRARSSSMRPASTFDTSRMSLRITSSASADWFAVFTNSRCRGVSRVCSASAVMPITAFIGVRISWLMLARNSPLATVAASARRRATSSSRTIRARRSVDSACCSAARLRSVTSRAAA